MRENVSERFSRDFRSGLVSLFIDNLNPIVDLECLWGIFRPFVKVRDISLHRGKRGRQSNFAFVRFETREETVKVARTTNGMHVYSWPISCKMAELGWKERRAGRSVENIRREEELRKERVRNQEGKPNHKSYGSVRGKKSFAEILKEGGRSAKMEISDKDKLEKRIKWMASKDETSWVELSVVGVLRSLKRNTDKREFLHNRFLWDDVFEYVEDQGNWMVSTTKARWFRLSGFPVKVWCPSFLKAVGNSFGITLHVEGRATLKGRMESCRILVATTEEIVCPEYVVMEMEKETCKVFIKDEEHGQAEDWVWEMLGISSNGYDLDGSEELGSPVKTASQGKLVIYDKKLRSRDRARGLRVTSEETDRVCKTKDRTFDKGKSVFVKTKKARHPSRTVGQSCVVIGKDKSGLRLSGYDTEGSMSSDEADVGNLVTRSGPIFVGEGSGGPLHSKLGNRGSFEGRVENHIRSKGLGQSLVNEKSMGLEDPIADSLAAKSPLGQSVIDPKDLYVDLGLVLNKVDPNQLVQEQSSLSSARGGEGSQNNELVVNDKMKRPGSCEGRGRGRSRTGASLNHGMRTRRSSKYPIQLETEGDNCEVETEFVKVIEESVSRGVNLEEANQVYGEDGGWCVEEEVAKGKEGQGSIYRYVIKVCSLCLVWVPESFMDCISWNVRGLGRTEKRRAVCKLVKKLKPSFLLLQELKVSSVDYRLIMLLGGGILTKGMKIDGVRSSGGLISMWNEEAFSIKACVNTDICSILLGELANVKKEVVICNVYASNVDVERVELWDFIVANTRRFLVPWIVGGDFNVVLEASEKI
ncbi:hypothetical protein Dsin_016921 [Dipteronia sinensis]|uniref:RRM domain-containing protein n=1 Tax=Dipteronia sinensis TaxID=43782 RepID=A0AAE0AFF9_9ROSI|nr:hypothetical protein Dsin_016921 [Dipteronia sinensis]